MKIGGHRRCRVGDIGDDHVSRAAVVRVGRGRRSRGKQPIGRGPGVRITGTTAVVVFLQIPIAVSLFQRD